MALQMRKLLLAALVGALPIHANQADSWRFNLDKRQHFALGMVIGGSVTLAFRWTGGSPKQSMRIGIAIGGMEAIRQEYHDWYANQLADSWMHHQIHSVSGPDAAYTFAGACLGSWIAYEFVK